MKNDFTIMAPTLDIDPDMIPAGFPGFWGEVTSSVDWCEPNYAWSSFIAEFWNSLSSFGMVAVGLAGIYLHRQVLETRFLLAFFFVSVLGLGSVSFHASLKHTTQMFDELPMLYAVMTVLFILLENKEEPVFGRWLAPVLVVHSLLTSCATLFASGSMQFVLFHISFGSAEFFSLYRIYLIYTKYRDSDSAASPDIVQLFRRGMGSYAVGIFVWQFDLLNCWVVAVWWPARTGLPNPQFHAWWHMFVSFGFYYLITLSAYDRLITLKGRPTLHWTCGGVMPYVKNSKKQN
eukprot:m.152104 g.152104  ORF g.152104 m.152104 type:complete len:290 (-) comp30791_c0_seq2:351-1220(-)